jgi:hypothetical protein
MENEYRESLERFEEMEKRWEELNSDFSRRGKEVEEKKFLDFMSDLDKYWPLMFAIEQRTIFRDLNFQAAKMVDVFYRSGVEGVRKPSVFGTSGGFVGLSGKIYKENPGEVAKLDSEIHEGEYIYDLNEVRGMADVIDKSNLKKKS